MEMLYILVISNSILHPLVLRRTYTKLLKSEKKVYCVYYPTVQIVKFPAFQCQKKVGQSVKEIFSEAQGRILFATFASNVHRLQQVVEASILYNRKVVVVGRSMEKQFKSEET